jgi:hypothetical protein
MKKLLFILLLINAFSSYAQNKIGVTAALKGEVFRLASDNAEALIGALDSGDAIYLGDDIKVSEGARLQVLLLDETVFTLGSGSQMVIDKFVYNPNEGTAELVTSITKGAFRFISGKVAKHSKDAMKVNLPSGIIGVRGTQVAGEVEEDGTSSIILVGPGINALGEAIGAITLTNSLGSVEITRPGYMTTMNSYTSPPTPVQATLEQIQNIEVKTLEDAELVIANELGIESIDIIPATDEDGDGFPDSIAPNTQLGQIILNATENNQATSDRGVIAAVFLTLAGEQALDTSSDQIGEFLNGVNLGGGASEVFGNGAKFLGDTTIAEFRNTSLTGTSTFIANGVAVSCSNSSTSGCGGSYDVTNTWNFASDTYRSQVSTNTGGIKLDTNDNGTLNVTLKFTIDKTTTLSDSFITDTSEPIYVHNSQELLAADMTSIAYTGSNQTNNWVGTDSELNKDSSYSGNTFSTNTSTTSSAPDANLDVESYGFVTNFELGGTSETANVGSHDLIIRKGATKLAQGVIYGMEKQ